MNRTIFVFIPLAAGQVLSHPQRLAGGLRRAVLQVKLVPCFPKNLLRVLLLRTVQHILHFTVEISASGSVFNLTIIGFLRGSTVDSDLNPCQTGKLLDGTVGVAREVLSSTYDPF